MPRPPTHCTAPPLPGKQVGEARRLLKLMQGLESAMQAAAEGPLQYQALKASGLAGRRGRWLLRG